MTAARMDPLLSVSGIEVRYRDGATGVSDVSLEVLPGQTVALLGANGAGKTTTLRAITGFLGSESTRILRGSIHFNGRDITNREPHHSAALGVMYVPERRKIFPNLTVMENLMALGRIPRGAERVRALRWVFELFPPLDQLKSRPAGQLSGGQQQMLAISRAIMSDSKLLLLDEMTLGLHHSLKPTLYDAVQEINRHGTSVLVSDESAEFALAICDYCYVIGGGVITAEGRPDELREGEILAQGYLS